MNILLYHPVRLPTQGYGGVERVVFWLAKGLTELGHRVTVACKEGSLLPPEWEYLALTESRCSPSVFFRSQSSRWDLVHLMAPAPEEDLKNWKVLLTVHGNGKPGEVFSKNSVFLTQNHARRHGSEVFVFNGIDPAELSFRKKKSNQLLFLSKTSWSVKNLKGAIAMCQKAGRRLGIAGGARPLGLRLKSRLLGYPWHGSVSGAQKADLLADASALVFPILWPEPFGLVIAEALMSGTPVFAFDRGGVRELISPEVGRVLKSSEEMIEVLKNPPVFDAEKCREHALRNFHYLKMSEKYVSLYKKVVAGQMLQSTEPVASNWRIEK